VCPLSLPPPLPMEFFFLYAETRLVARTRRKISVGSASHVA